MSTLHYAILGFLAVIILFVAYKIGKILLRLVLGLAVMAGAGYLVWRFLMHP